jgi:type IV pilus assembly protein PilW
MEKIRKFAAGRFSDQHQRQRQIIRKYFNISSLRNLFSNANFGDRGFSVAEFLVAFALLSVMLAVMVKLFGLINQSYTTQNVAANVQQVVRNGIDIMTQNIRMAGFNPLKLSDVGIKSDFSQNNIHFSYDLDSDGTVMSDEDIRFFHEDQKLKKQKRGGNRITLIDNVTNLKFSYLDENDQATENQADIKTVVISLTVSEPAGRRRSLSRTYTTRVICRNLGL